MRYNLSQPYFRGYLLDDEIETGKDYLYCPINRAPTHARIVGYAATRDGTPVVYYWREVKSDGSLSIEEHGTLALFKPLPEDRKLDLKKLIPTIALRGTFTAQLRRPKVPECQC